MQTDRHTDAEADARALADEPIPPLWKRLGLHGPRIIWRFILRSGKRIAVFVLGMALVVAGVAMLVLPGPGIVVIIAGLAVLATEFAWAERMLDSAKRHAAKAATKAKQAGGGLRRRKSG